MTMRPTVLWINRCVHRGICNRTVGINMENTEMSGRKQLAVILNTAVERGCRVQPLGSNTVAQIQLRKNAGTPGRCIEAFAQV